LGKVLNRFHSRSRALPACSSHEKTQNAQKAGAISIRIQMVHEVKPMQSMLTVILAIGVLGVLVWLMIPTASTGNNRTGSTDPFIDPDDSYQIGLLVGMTGGSVPDAAVMRFALQRFQELYGRRATSTDIGIVLGLIHTIE
jgi:hypothetical protein